MMMEQIPPRIVDVLCDLVKSAQNYSGEVDSDKSVVETLYKSFNELTTIAEEKLEQHISDENLDPIIQLYFFISKVLINAAPLIKNRSVSSIIKSNSFVYSRGANDTIVSAVSYNTAKSIETRRNGQYTESIYYKNISTDLQYKIKNGIFEEMVNQQATELVSKCLNLSSKELIQEGNKTDNIQRMIIYPDLIRVENVYRLSESKKQWYDWSVYLVAEDNVMNQIENVVYILHPTFLQNEKTIYDPKDGFKLDATGWGEFEITANIGFKDKKIDMITKYHWLDLGKQGRRRDI
jgi:hypothetical protein